MMDRRTFTFASLVGLGTASAATAGIPEADSAHGLRASWAVARKGPLLKATLTLHNDGAEALDVMVARGSRPGPQVAARLGGEDLPEVLTDLERREWMSRIGPRPKFDALAAGRSKEIGTYTFQLTDPDVREVELSVGVTTGDDHVQLPAQTVRIGGKAES